MGQRVGTALWMAPEILNGKRQTTESDVVRLDPNHNVTIHVSEIGRKCPVFGIGQMAAVVGCRVPVCPANDEPQSCCLTTC